MTTHEIARLAPAFAAYLKSYQVCFLKDKTQAHFGNYCRGLMSNLDRKSVEPIAIEAGTAIRTLQEFLTTSQWNHLRARDILQRRLAEFIAQLPEDDLGTVGIIDETSVVKKGRKTPGVQRQYLGCVGKTENGIVTVHIGLAQGRFHALADADLYLPRSWDEDRERCRKAGIPDELRYRAKWKIAFHQYLHLSDNGVSPNWLCFDAEYGAKVPFLWLLGRIGQKFVGEVPKSFAVRMHPDGPSQRADALQPGQVTKGWQRFRHRRKTVADQCWRAKARRVWVARGWHLLVTAVHETTGEVKYFITNAVDTPLKTVLRVAFKRAMIEHGFRLAKQEAGMMHYEGRDYTGLMRHLILSLVVLGFVVTHTERLRGEKSTVDCGASMRSPQHPLRVHLSEATANA